MASARPGEIEDADQVRVIVDREYDEPEIAQVRNPPSRHSGRCAEHRVVGVFADPGYQGHEHVERLLGQAAHLPERTRLQIRPVAHLERRTRM